MAVNDAQRAAVESYFDRKLLELVEHELLSLKILDPAMGSAHFLVAAGQMLTNFIVETLNALDWVNEAISTDPLVWKRRVVERCLYGVDVNPLAQELAKLSLWLTSAAEGKPLTFLDHHLKVGNSLYGAPLAKLASLPNARTAQGSDDMFRLANQPVLDEVLAQLASITASDSEHIEDVKSKGKAYHAAWAQARRLRDVADVWLATLFDLAMPSGKPLDEATYFALLTESVRDYSPEAWDAYADGQPVIKQARQIAAKNLFFHWELEFPDTLVDGQCAFDVVITNPPYVGMAPDYPVSKLYKTANCGDLYGWLFERCLHVLGKGGTLGLIVPLSLTFAKSFASLRKLLLDNQMHLSLSSYDNVPDGIFNGGKISENTSTENMQRTTIVLGTKTGTSTEIETTDLLRWWHQERIVLFDNLRFAKTTSVSSAANFPKIGNDVFVEFWQRLSLSDRRLTDIAEEIYSEAKRPDPSSLSITVPRAAGYFISATPGIMARNKILSMTFSNKQDLDLARVLINSNVFFWYWRAFGDGFLLGVELLGAFPIPNNIDSQYLSLASSLDEVISECTTYKMYRGEKIPSYNFNKRMDVLLRIDEWIVNKVAPDLGLTREAFTGQKSNSFMRPLDLRELAAVESESDE